MQAPPPGVDHYVWCEARDIIIFFPIWPSIRLKIKSILSPLVYNASYAIYLCKFILYLCDSVSRLLILFPGSIYSLLLSLSLLLFITLYNFIILLKLALAILSSSITIRILRWVCQDP